MKLSFIILSLVSGLALSAPPRELSFYAVSPVEGKAPVVDGCLNEAAWEKAAVFRHYYVYNCAEPTPGNSRRNSVCCMMKKESTWASSISRSIRKIEEDHYRL